MEEKQLTMKGEFQYNDPSTGEVWHLKWDDSDSAKKAWQQLTALKKNVDLAIKSVQTQFEEYLASQDIEQLDFRDGETIRRQATARRTYGKDVLRKYLNEDEMDLVTAPVNALVKDLFADKVQHGELPAGAFRDLEEHADVSWSYSMRIVKTNRKVK